MSGRPNTICVAAVLIAVSSNAASAADDPETTLSAISIQAPSFHNEKTSFLTKKVMSFTVKNGSKTVIKTLFFHAKLQTPGRTLPWVESDQNYTFPGGLEPGETRHLDLVPNMFGDWAKAEDQWLKTGVLSLSVVGIEDATGHKIESEAAAPK